MTVEILLVIKVYTSKTSYLKVLIIENSHLYMRNRSNL